MSSLRLTQFDQCVLNISLINMCNQTSHVGQEMHKLNHSWQAETDEPSRNPWLEPHWFTIYLPHPDQEYDGLTLEQGLTKGYNVELKFVEDKGRMLYNVPSGGHFVVVLKQKGLDGDFTIAGTGIFVRPLAVISLDLIVDLEKMEYQSLVIKHPVIRDYPTNWEKQLKMFISHEIHWSDLPNLVEHVDQVFNQDYRPPSWHEVHLAAKRFAGV